jgi:CubicO group peptidase (beta-lactamase class C family)
MRINHLGLIILSLFTSCSSSNEPKIDIDKMDTEETMTGPYSFYVPPYSLYYFHHMDKLGFHLDWIRRSGPVYELHEPKNPFNVNYTYESQTYSLADYYQRNTVLGFLILKDNQIILERYFYGSDQNSRFLSMSVQKSITSTLFGIALEEGKIGRIDDPVTKYLPGLSKSGYNRVNLKQTLMMATGIEANEDSLDPNSSIHQFNAMTLRGVPSFYDYIKEIKANPNVKPGTVFDYQTINTEVLGLVIEKATKIPLNEYMQMKLWSKIGAESDAFIFRAKKQPDQGAYGCFCATLRDYGRFGLLMMNGGTLGNVRAVSSSWVNEATRSQYYSVKPPASGGYGYQWWISVNKDGAYQANGIFGQVIYINPAKSIVIAINSAWPQPDPDAKWDEMDQVINAIVAKLSQSE